MPSSLMILSCLVVPLIWLVTDSRMSFPIFSLLKEETPTLENVLFIIGIYLTHEYGC